MSSPRPSLSRASLTLALAGVALFSVEGRAVPLGAPGPGPATFALVVGTNASVDSELEPLRYADDDAARYYDLFASLGAKTYLLSSLDDDTARLHPDAARAAHPPRGQTLDATVALLAADVEAAKAAGRETTLYFVYAGHGNVEGRRGYITLEDARLFGDDLIERVVARADAGQTHLIVDACYSYFLAYGRGPGGSRRPVEGFSRLKQLADRGRVGLILSTSAAAESHEWEAFQSGVFSHEVRSGLYGAADADNDGVVRYQELAAFVEQANAAIPNERYRPKLHARAPEGKDALLAIADPAEDRAFLDVAGNMPGRYFMESRLGVRLADFHSAPGQAVSLLLPSDELVYLRNVDEDVEYEVTPGAHRVRLASLEPQMPRVQGRGSAHHAFSLLFKFPFDEEVVEGYAVSTSSASETGGAGLPWASIAGWSGIGMGTLLVVASAGITAFGGYEYLTADPAESQIRTAERNQTIFLANVAGLSLLGAAALTAGAGTTALLLLPEPEGD